MAGTRDQRPRRPRPPPDDRKTTLAPVSDYQEEEITGPIDVMPTERGKPPQTGASAIVVVIKPPAAMPGHRYSLARDEYTVGRKLDCDIALDVGSVSRRHARLFRKGEAWYVEDLGSTNGTFVNDEPVAVATPRRLRDGDRVAFGEAVLRFLAGTNIEVQYHEEIYRLAILDGLTGVHNRRFFSEVLEREVAHSHRHGSAVSLVMFDLDRFKQVNDTHGHPAGDAVLQGICRRLKQRIRKDDMLARVGGEEFAFLLVDTGREGAVAFAEQMRQLVEREPIVHDGKELRVTISLGVASIEIGQSAGDTAATAEDLIRRADANLYEAKAAGRNRVVG